MNFASRSRLLIGIVPAALLAGCPVDDRDLKLGSAQQGGNLSAGRAGQASGGTGGSGGNGGTMSNVGGADDPSTEGGAGGAGNDGPTYPPLADGCVDLDEDHVGDCTQGLLQNPDFKTTAMSWTGDFGAKLAWSAENAFGDKPSGTASLTSVGSVDREGLFDAAASQCIAITPETKLDVWANAFIPGEQGDGLASVGIFFFDQANCMGSLVDSLNASAAQRDTWLTLHDKRTVPATVASMRVRIIITRPYRSDSFKASFDNVLVRSL